MITSDLMCRRAGQSGHRARNDLGNLSQLLLPGLGHPRDAVSFPTRSCDQTRVHTYQGHALGLPVCTYRGWRHGPEDGAHAHLLSAGGGDGVSVDVFHLLHEPKRQSPAGRVCARSRAPRLLRADQVSTHGTIFFFFFLFGEQFVTVAFTVIP